MASLNPFDILGNDDNDDPSQLIEAALQQKIAEKKAIDTAAPQAPAKLPTKPLPPAQAAREARNNAALPRGGFGGGRGRGGRGERYFQKRTFANGDANGFSASQDGREDRETNNTHERGYGPRQPYRGGHRGYVNGEAGSESERPPRRVFERCSGTGRGNEIKRDGAGRGNWGTPTDDVFPQESEEVVTVEEKAPISETHVENGNSDTEKNNKEAAANRTEEKEQEEKEMTLEEYEKIREEKRKALLAMRAEERKVDPKEFESMQQLSLKKGNDEIFIKLGTEKDSRKQKENGDRDEKVKKSVSINEFLKPAEGERMNYGRGRGRGQSGSFRGGFGGRNYGSSSPSEVIQIADPGQFPLLAGK